MFPTRSVRRLYRTAPCLFFLATCFTLAQSEPETDPLLDPLPEMEIAQMEKELPASSLVLSETYGTGNGKVQTTEFFGTPTKGTLEISGEELIITNDTGEPGTVQLAVKDFPVTVDIRMRMQVQSNGYFSLSAYTPFASESNRERVSQIFFTMNNIANPPTKTSLPFRGQHEPTTFRIIFDSEGKGRLCVLDGSGLSLPIGGMEMQGGYRSIDLGLLNATVTIEQVTVYSEIP